MFRNSTNGNIHPTSTLDLHDVGGGIMGYCDYDMHKFGVMSELKQKYSKEILDIYSDEISDSIYYNYSEGETEDCICSSECVEELIDFIDEQERDFKGEADDLAIKSSQEDRITGSK